MLIKTEEDYYKVLYLIETIEDMSWLSDKVESSLKDISDCEEKRILNQALEDIHTTYILINEELKRYEEENNME